MPREVFLRVLCDHPDLALHFLASFAEAASARLAPAVPGGRAAYARDADLSLFGTRVGDLAARGPIAVESGLAIRDAARIMLKEHAGSLLVRDAQGRTAGIVTDKDLRKAVALGRDAESPVKTIMSSPVMDIAGHEPCFDALLKMMAHGVHHLAVTGPDGVAGVVTAHDILALQGTSPLSLFREIEATRGVSGLYPLSARSPRVIRALMDTGARPGHVTRLITVVNDLILRKIIEMVTREIGPPPAAWCWMSMGSEGRREQTFATDQDNALIHADCRDEAVRRAAGVYFQALAERVVGHLDKAGFPRCKGDMMASNPAWRKSLSDWKDTFDDWIAVPEAKEVLHATIFFDFRGVAGQVGLAEELRGHVAERAAENGIFLRFLAADCLATRPPLTFFKGFVVEKNGDRKNTLDLKKRGLVPFQDFARVLALSHGVRETSTLGRIETLVKNGHLPRELGREVAQAFEFLLQVKLSHQLAQVEQGRPPDNFIDPGRLSDLDKSTLRQAFGVIGSMQTFLKDMFRLNLG
jgi:CBS domain-containing protein